jgi:hypothetical protein
MIVGTFTRAVLQYQGPTKYLTKPTIGKYCGMKGNKRYEEKRPVDSKALLIWRTEFQRSAHFVYIWFVEHTENFNVYEV